ncbi:MAG: sensor histidine kinase [Salinarimonas sp.]
MRMQKTEHENAPGLSFLLEEPRLLPNAGTRSEPYVSANVAALLAHKDTLMREVHHRVGNSLQIIASVLARDAREVQSLEVRRHLENAHRRILAVATMEQQLQLPHEDHDIEIAAYLDRLGKSLTESVVADSTQITISVDAEARMVPADVAMSLGLIVSELVINALKHAFTAGTNGRITVTYRVDGQDWHLIVSDNGVGMPIGDYRPGATGLGKSIIAALVMQLAAHFDASGTVNGSGNSVSISGRFADGM